MRNFTTARERDAYERSLRDEDQRLWKDKIHQLKLARRRHEQARLEQERINAQLDRSPSLKPMQYEQGEKRDEPRITFGRNGYRKATPQGQERHTQR